MKSSRLQKSKQKAYLQSEHLLNLKSRLCHQLKCILIQTVLNLSFWMTRWRLCNKSLFSLARSLNNWQNRCQNTKAKILLKRFSCNYKTLSNSNQKRIEGDSKSTMMRVKCVSKDFLKSRTGLVSWGHSSNHLRNVC